MIRTLTLWELGLVLAFALVILQQLGALLLARRKGLTRNVSRVVTFSASLALAVIYFGVTANWLRVLDAADPLTAMRRLPTGNWGYLVLVMMIGLVLAYEVASHVHALRAGLTSNLSRLMALGIAVLLLLVLLGMSDLKWELYLQQLEAVVQDSLAGGAGR